MKELLICDCTTPELYIELCQQIPCGMEFQEFYHPEEDEVSPKLMESKAAIPGSIAIHAPFFDLVPGSLDTAIREVTKSRFMRSIDHATTLGAKYIVFHNSYFPNVHLPNGWAERAILFWKELLTHLPAQSKLILLLENTLEESPDIIIEILDAVNHPNLGANLDVGHAHAFSKCPVTEWIALLGDRISYVHLHDNHGERDDHLGIGKGAVPWRATCEALGRYAPNAAWAIEARGGEEVNCSVEWLRREWGMG